MTKGRIVCFLMETVKADDGGYIPCLCREGESGYWPTDWNWGTNKKQAQEWADERNTTMGMTPKEAMLIQLETMKLQKEQKNEKEKHNYFSE